MLTWFDSNPLRYWLLVTLVVSGVLFILVRPFLQPTWQDRKETDWLWSLAIGIILAAGRWPTWLITRQLNPDESLFITGANTLRYDPFYWRSVDVGTVGPLDVFILRPAGWLFGSDDFFSARVTAFLLIALALAFTHQTLALVFGRQIARVCVLPATLLEALTMHADLLHYSSELLPMALISAALFCLARRLTGHSTWRGNIVAGILLGAVPFAKLQATVPAALLGLTWCFLEYQRRDSRNPDGTKGLIALLSGAVTPTIFCIGYLTFMDLWQFAVTTYLHNNLSYLNHGSLSVPHLLLALAQSAFVGTSLLPQFFGGGLLWLLITLSLPRASVASGQLMAIVATLLLLASIFAVIAPARPFLHYTQLLVVPWTLVLGSATGFVANAFADKGTAKYIAVLCAALLCNLAGLLYARSGPSILGAGDLASAQATKQSTVAREILKYARVGETLAQWGWMTQYFVETGLHQATRRADSSGEIPSGPYSEYYRQTFLEDLRLSMPPVFIDVTGPGNFYFSDRLLSFETTFPELAKFIRTHYSLVNEIDGARIYVRKDRHSRHP